MQKYFRLSSIAIKSGFFALAIYILGCSKAQLPTSPESPTSKIQVLAAHQDGSSVDSAKVFLDGQFVGMTPFTVEGVAEGQHALRVLKEGFQIFTQSLIVENGISYTVEAVLTPLPSNEGELLITVNQDSVLVFVKDINENVVVRTTERTSSHILPSGAYIVSGEKEGCEKVEKAIEISAGNSTAVNLELVDLTVEVPDLEFSIKEDTVALGEAMNLSWNSNGYQVIIDNGVGVRGPNGSEKVVCPSPGLKVFTATAYSVDNVTTEKKDTVYVSVIPQQPPDLDFSIDQETVVYGEPVLIEWQSNGWQVVIDHGIGARGPMGAEEMQFANPGKKILTATAYGENDLLTIRQDSVIVEEAPLPALPVVMLSTTRLVTVDMPATITWHVQNANFLAVDYVENPDLQGSVDITFSTLGIRIVTATAFNQSGYTTANDTIEVVESAVTCVDDILLPASVVVRADKGESGMYDLDAASFVVESAGDYQLYAEVWYNSGDSQLNESYFIRLRNESDVTLFPQDPNAGFDKVVPDDPGEPHTLSQRSGVFKLTEGEYKIDVIHYAKISDAYPEFLNEEIDGPESVKILGFKLVCLND